ncbi:hypothetical protein [Pararhizobium sp. IMCC21322]|uniref:cell division protein FtsL n=1 Tax=Pararhizobium sp. IMCC21322 TaxID=3067903 RepID=UPI002740AFBA|nr:hypothetical protein [Pararhizobium sp. IMCC21322]
MLRHTWTLFLCLMMVAAAAVTYQIKYQAELATEEARDMVSEINGLEEDISRLKAQWSLLNQPSRLQALVENNAEVLPLTPLAPHQIALLDNIPERSPMSLIVPRRKPFSLAYESNTLAKLINQTSEPSLADLIGSEAR